MNWAISRLFWGDFFIYCLHKKRYSAVLKRLKANKPTILPKGFAINNDTVALEAGRKRGSIKKSRHAALIEAVELAAQQAGQNVLSPIQRIQR